jgi:hypothetical protein
MLDKLENIDKEGDGWKADWYAIGIDLDRWAIENALTENIVEISHQDEPHSLILTYPSARRLFKVLKEALEKTASTEDLSGDIEELGLNK